MKRKLIQNRNGKINITILIVGLIFSSVLNFSQIKGKNYKIANQNYETIFDSTLVWAQNSYGFFWIEKKTQAEGILRFVRLNKRGKILRESVVLTDIIYTKNIETLWTGKHFWFFSDEYRPGLQTPSISAVKITENGNLESRTIWPVVGLTCDYYTAVSPAAVWNGRHIGLVFFLKGSSCQIDGVYFLLLDKELKPMKNLIKLGGSGFEKNIRIFWKTNEFVVYWDSNESNKDTTTFIQRVAANGMIRKTVKEIKPAGGAVRFFGEGRYSHAYVESSQELYFASLKKNFKRMKPSHLIRKTDSTIGMPVFTQHQNTFRFFWPEYSGFSLESHLYTASLTGEGDMIKSPLRLTDYPAPDSFLYEYPLAIGIQEGIFLLVFSRNQNGDKTIWTHVQR